jgi:hypothetical protein
LEKESKRAIKRAGYESQKVKKLYKRSGKYSILAII